MSLDPRAALQSLTSAFEEHLVAASARRGDDDPAVEAAYLAIVDAFEIYEEVLFESYNEVTPLVIYEDEEDAEEDEEDSVGDDDDLEPIDD
ncbi:MAG: hypothetical protein M3021_08275 [Actinomycetota bacterium]|uniref:hypothetical protein n=1 Tax=Micrococcaceae TaxID=1268 RepID=UPI0024BBE0C3|nr:hypothetical protein [Paenarthrobacter sp. PH39-S1]MDJ0356754.1 hypothetical protein [Paenarthrobacter sp. PH39-S1]MDQ6740348.1 hypothetical protein [Actinomycetota bacterium]